MFAFDKVFVPGPTTVTVLVTPGALETIPDKASESPADVVAVNVSFKEIAVEIVLDVPALTADRAWQGIAAQAGVRVEMIS